MCVRACMHACVCVCVRMCVCVCVKSCLCLQSQEILDNLPFTLRQVCLALP